MSELEALKNEVDDLKATLHTMGKHQADDNARRGIDYELKQQAPDMPQEIRQLARTALSGTKGDPTQAETAFLANEETKALISNHAAQSGAQAQQARQTTQPGKRPSLAEMMGDLESGNAQFRM